MAKNPPKAVLAQASAEMNGELALLRDKLADRWWRLTSGVIYKVKTKDGRVVPFIPNECQEDYFKRRHIRNVILKGRQIGMTTAIFILNLDKTLFSKYRNSGVIAQDLESAGDVFRNKIKFAYEHIPEWLKEQFPVKTDRAGQMVFSGNGSEISVDTSFRSGTLQALHITELGPICAANPEKAEEIRSGALNTVSPDCEVDIESTAAGAEGLFFDLCREAMSKEQMGKKLTNLDYKFFFYPWFIEKGYSVDDDVDLSRETEEYFEKLEADEYFRTRYPSVKFTIGQKRWYQLKKAEQKDKMEREFPSTPAEAFQTAVKGAYYEKELMRLRQQNRICRVPYDSRLPVECAWDMGGYGGGDETSIWFWQQYGNEIRIIDFWSGSGYSMADIYREVRAKDYHTLTTNYLPHDSEVTESTGVRRIDALRRMGLKCVSLRKQMQTSDGINAVRDIFPRCFFDEKNCAEGLSHLAQYRREWDSRKGGFKDKPFHDRAGHSDAADAFRYLAQAVQRAREGDGMDKPILQDFGLDAMMR